MIRWDALLARHTARELDGLLRGSELRALRLDGDARDVVMLFGEHALLWRLHPTKGHLRLLTPLEPAEGDLAVRARLEGVTSVPDDRVLRFALAPKGSARAPMSLVVELLGNQWNAVLTEGAPLGPEPEIVRHVLWRRDGGRGARVGYPYRPPPPLRRQGVEGDVPLQAWLDVLARLPAGDRHAALVRTFAWTSPINAAALLGAAAAQAVDRACAAEAHSEAHSEAEALASGYRRWLRMVDPRAAGEPVVLATDSGSQPYPFPLHGTPHEAVDSMLAAIAGAVPSEPDDPDVAAEAAAAAAPIGPALMRRLEGDAARSGRRVERLQAELAGLTDPEALRRTADLILARYREIPAGASRARLVGFDGEAREIELDPAERPHDTAARYYAAAAKSERARAQLPRLIEEARAECVRAEALLAEALAGGVDEDALREVLGPDRPVERGQVVGPALPYRSYRSTGGLEIRVGRGARHNDDLTFHHASPDDVWLHARDNAGAHVVLRWNGPGKPPARDLGEAATLAALHSKARTSGSAPVDWTLRKYVRKPRKSPPGRVVADRVQTLFVEPDAELLGRLERLR
jgi:hypothetical protein